MRRERIRRLGLGAAFLFALLTIGAVACDGDDKPPAAVDTPTAAPTATATPDPAVELAAKIGVRGGLPENDPLDLAARFGKTDGRAPISKPFAGEPAIGSSRDFIVQRISGAAYAGTAPPQNVTISATLAAVSEHAYFYVDDALGFDAAAAEDAAADFEETVWPSVTGALGEPAIPGVDGDPRIIVLQADLGGAVGGYYSGDDAYLRSVRPASNEAEIVYLDRGLSLGGASFNVVLAHELQHLVHARLDGSEEAWINEGLSETALGLAGGALSSIDTFAARPDTQLNTWLTEDSSSHYGAGASFTRYLADRFGGVNELGAIARAEGDGAAGIDEYLDGVDPELTFREAVADWMAANVLNRAEGRFGNPSAPVDVNVQYELAEASPALGEASQFGADYYALEGLGAGEYVVRFDGAAGVPALPPPALERGAVLWSNAEDEIDTKLTLPLDLRGAASPALTFKTWFDIEPWYDWGYVAVSTDGGATWEALTGAHTRDDDAVQVAYGPGYSGTSGGGQEPAWVDERVDLSAYAGQEVLVRFEYVTDGASHGEGWAIDDVAVSGGVFGDSDGLDASWNFDGWVRVDVPLRQQWIVRLIGERGDGEPVVLDADIGLDGNGELRFAADGLFDVVLAIAGATEGTRQRAPYTVELLRAASPTP